jgi:hypothetical protein
MEVQHLAALTAHARCNSQAGMETTKRRQSAKAETVLPALLEDGRELMNGLT